MGETWENGVRRPKREKTAELTVESAETWENSGKGRNMGKQCKRPKHGKTMESAETWENGGRTSETWHWSVAKWRKPGKRPEREKPLERENPAERNGGISRKRGKTVAAWPETWENGGRMAEVEKNGGRTAETWENGGRTTETWENGGRTAETEGKRWHVDGNG